LLSKTIQKEKMEESKHNRFTKAKMEEIIHKSKHLRKKYNCSQSKKHRKKHNLNLFCWKGMSSVHKAKMEKRKTVIHSQIWKERYTIR